LCILIYLIKKKNKIEREKESYNYKEYI
jgi:hypothetical protein